MRAVDLTLEVANLQQELGGVQARLKYLGRVKSRTGEGKVEENKLEESKVDNLDSSFAQQLVLED